MTKSEPPSSRPKPPPVPAPQRGSGAGEGAGDGPSGPDPLFDELLVRLDAQIASGGEPPPADPAGDGASAIELLRLLAAYRRIADPRDPTALARGQFPRPFGRFTLVEFLGRGGHGVVFRAVDPALDREVALKVPRPDAIWAPEIRERFLYEGKAVANLDHPNVNPVYEAGEIDGICYMASHLCTGPTLAHWLRACPEPLPVERAVRLIAAVADGVAHAHSSGLLHRDLKPANVLLNPDDTAPRVTDFGLARALATDDGGLTLTGQLIGTVEYMAPEQAAGDHRRVGVHTDVYALGVMLYELLTGARPFGDRPRVETLRLIIAGDIPRPLRDGARLPRDLESVCLKCLERNPARRYATAAELAADLRRFLAREPVTARPCGSARLLAAWFRRRPAAAGFAAASLLALVVLTIAASWHSYQLELKNDLLLLALDETASQRAEAERQRQIAEDRATEARNAAYAVQVRIVGRMWNGNQVGLMGTYLENVTPRPGDPDPREFTWRLLKHYSRNDEWLVGHQRFVRGLAFDRPGTNLYTVSEDRTVRVWDVSTGLVRTQLADVCDAQPFGVAEAPGGRFVAVASGPGPDCRLQIWDVHLKTPVAAVRCNQLLHFSDLVLPGGEQVLVNRNPELNAAGAVLHWNWRTGELRHLLADQYQCTAMALSPDGRYVAAACQKVRYGKSNRVLLLSPDTWTVCAEFPEVTGLLNSIAFSPDGRTLAAAGTDETAILWDFETRTERLRVKHRGENTESIAFTNQGRWVVTLAVEPGVPLVARRIRDARTGAEVAPVVRYDCDPNLLAVTPDDERLVTVHNNVIQIKRLRPPPPFERLPGHRAETWGLAFAPDGRSLFSSSDDHTVVAWDLGTATRRQTLEGHESLASCVAAAPTGWVTSGSYDNTVKLWDPSSGKCIRTLEGHTRPVRGVAVDPGGRLVASVSRDHTTRLWDVVTGRQLTVWTDHQGDARAVAFTPDGRHLITGGNDHVLAIRTLSTGTVRRIVTPAQIYSLVVAPDGQRVYFAGSDGIVRVFTIATGEVGALMGGHTAPIEAIAISPDGRTLATTGLDKTLRLWHVPTATELFVFDTLSDRGHAVAFAPDGNTLAVGLMDGSVLLWKTATTTRNR